MVELGQTELHVLWRETNSRLDSFALGVKECKGLDYALDFCRFVHWSGIIEIFKINAQPYPLLVDGSLTQYKVEELQRDIRARYISGDVQPHIDVAELQRINYKLDLIAGRLSYLPVPAIEDTGQPLILMDGGLKS